MEDNVKVNEEEAKAELVSFVKANFLHIKKWYSTALDPSGSGTLLRETLGEFPLISRDFIESWDEDSRSQVLKLFRRHLSVQEANQGKENSGEEGNGRKQKRNRWGKKKNEENDGEGGSGEDQENEAKKQRKSRWDNSTDLVKTGSSELRVLQQQKTFWLRLKIDEINQKLLVVHDEAKKKLNDPERSPSPEPIYDQHGRRVNTLEVRMKQKLDSQKLELMEELVKLNPSLKPKGGKLGISSKKLYVPVKDFPGYNFLGLIIGPRGMTQKRMETETNTKITIRGKGSVRPGRGKLEEDAHEDLHILIEGEDEDDVERAADMVSKLLTPNHPFLESHKQKQMMELALINGTVKQDAFCNYCGSASHKTYECPKQTLSATNIPKVQCKICHETSHPTSDCPLKNDPAAQQLLQQDNQLDKDYNEFMQMVSGDAEPLPAKSALTNSNDATNNVSVFNVNNVSNIQGLGVNPVTSVDVNKIPKVSLVTPKPFVSPYMAGANVFTQPLYMSQINTGNIAGQQPLYSNLPTGLGFGYGVSSVPNINFGYSYAGNANVANGYYQNGSVAASNVQTQQVGNVQVASATHPYPVVQKPLN